MAKRNKTRVVDQNEVFKMLELRMGIIQHTQALKAVVQLLSQDKKQAAVARLDNAVTALHALVRGQCSGQTMECPHCKSPQDVIAWVDDGMCRECGELLEIPGASTDQE